MHSPKISVIVPVYNAEKWLRRCVDSILVQIFTDFELLLIDDGSTDGSGAICDEYAMLDSRVRVFHKPNGGVSSARNLGLDNAKGEWISFVDSDDWLEPIYINTLLSRVDADLIIVNYIIHRNYGNTSLPSQNEFYAGDYVLYDFLKGYINVHILRAPWGKLFKREIIERIHLRFIDDIVTCEDIIFVLSYSIKCKSIRIYDSALYHYEFSAVNGDSSLSRCSNLYIEQYEVVFNALWDINEKFKSQIGIDDDILITTYIKWIFYVTLDAVISSRNNNIIRAFGHNINVRRTIAALTKISAFGVKGKITLFLMQKGWSRLVLFLELIPPQISGMKNN